MDLIHALRIPVERSARTVPANAKGILRSGARAADFEGTQRAIRKAQHGRGVVFVGDGPLRALGNQRRVDPDDFLDGADIHARIEGKDRSFRALHDHDGEAVGQFLDGDPLFKRSDVLRMEVECDGRKQNHECERTGERNLHSVSENQRSRPNQG